MQNINFTYSKITCFYYYNIELEDHKWACLSRYKDNMRLFWLLKTKLLNKLQHTEIYLLSYFYFFTFHVAIKT